MSAALAAAPRTLEEAREQHVQGWNIACQRCGNFGATWVAHPLPQQNRQRLCETCRSDHQQLVSAIGEFYRVQFTQDGMPAGEPFAFRALTGSVVSPPRVNVPAGIPDAGSFDDEDAYNVNTDRLDGRKIKVPCPGCGRLGSPLCSTNTTRTGGGWRWVGLDHKEPYTDYLARCRCGTEYTFSTHTPQ